MPTVAEVVVFACVIGFGVASIAAQSPGGAHRAGLGPEVLVAGWFVVFAALAGLYVHDRRQRVARRVVVGVPEPKAPGAPEPKAPGAPEPEAPGAPEPEAPEREVDRVARPKRMTALEHVFVGPGRRTTPPAAGRPGRAPDPGARTSPSSKGPAPAVPAQQPSAATRQVPLPRRPPAPPVEGRLVEAARVAPGALVNGDDRGPRLVALSRAQLARGQTDRAIETARQALAVWRSRESVAHLIRVLTETRRFGPADGPMLRRAAARHPNQAMLRHALGVFESMHGDPRVAREQLLAAVRLETDREARRVIERDLGHTREGSALAPRCAAP